MNTESSLPLSGRIALVTGAGSGMGAAIASHLAALGASVAVLGRREDRLQAVAGSAAASAGRILPVPADVTSDADVSAALERVHAELGRVDLLVNAAGVMLPNPLADGRADEWERMIDTNLTGLLRVTRAVLPDLLGGTGVRDIVNVSSIAAHAVFPDYAVYAATKAAVTALSAMQRTELARRGVRVTNVEPGLTATELGTHIGNERLAAELAAMFAAIEAVSADDIADLVDFVVTRPAHVNLRQVVILPTQQA